MCVSVSKPQRGLNTRDDKIESSIMAGFINQVFGDLADEMRCVRQDKRKKEGRRPKSRAFIHIEKANIQRGRRTGKDEDGK